MLLMTNLALNLHIFSSVDSRAHFGFKALVFCGAHVLRPLVLKTGIKMSNPVTSDLNKNILNTCRDSNQIPVGQTFFSVPNMFE